MRIPVLILSLFVVIMSFQNCGQVTSNSHFLDDQNGTFSSFNASDCAAGACAGAEEYLWLRIREYQPLKVAIADFNVRKTFTVGGECGASTFVDHEVEWRMLKNFESQDVVGAGFVPNPCVNGQFSITIRPSQNLEADKRYQVTLELVGINSNFQPVFNPMPDSVGSVDVLITP